MDRPLEAKAKARADAARDVIEALTDWLVDEDGAHWAEDVNGADFVAAMTQALARYRRAVGLPALKDQ